MRFQYRLFLASGLVALLPLSLCPAPAHSATGARPSLVINHAPVPKELTENAYQTPAPARDIAPDEITGGAYYKPTETIVTRRIKALEADLLKIQNDTSSLSAQLANLQRENQNKSAEYYAAVATINTQLQNGTTPGNPRLLQRFARAETSLENLGATIADMNQMSIDVSRTATEASFLLETIRSAFSLSGAVEEDHVKLKKLEDSVNNTLVIVDRIANTVSDDISRTSTYLSSERSNLRALSLAVTHGDLYGKSLGNRPFSSVESYRGGNIAASQTASVTPAAPKTPRPLVKIRFDRTDVDYEQPLYMAVNEALERYPNARFDLVAVHPSRGNAATVAIESTRARRNAERVLRTLTEMGMPMENIDLSYDQSPTATSSEVHVYVH